MHIYMMTHIIYTACPDIQSVANLNPNIAWPINGGALAFSSTPWSFTICTSYTSNATGSKLGHYTNQSILEKKSYDGGIPSESWSSRTQCPRLQRSPYVRSWVVFSPIHCLLIKRILLPICVLCFSHVYWLMNNVIYIINMFFI